MRYDQNLKSLFKINNEDERKDPLSFKNIRRNTKLVSLQILTIHLYVRKYFTNYGTLLSFSVQNASTSANTMVPKYIS